MIDNYLEQKGRNFSGIMDLLADALMLSLTNAISPTIMGQS